MFLSLLSRKEKLKFLDIAVHMIDIDGEPNVSEKKILNNMFGEVGLDIFEEYTFKKSKSVDDTINFFKKSNKVVRNIVFLNLVKITMIDDLYNTLEHLFLEKLEKDLQITTSKREELMRIVYEERDIREKALRVVKE
ncbi:MAG: hypothetical protein ACRC5M_05790 [Anaeroplasmataceae bacterium]